MPQPTAYEVHVDRPLTEISVAYIQEDTNFIAGKAFTTFPVDKKSDKYFEYTQADWFRDEARQRAGGTESAGSGYGMSTGDYTCKVWALHKDVDNQVIQNSDAPLNPLADASRFLTQKMLLKQEAEWVSAYFATSKWGTDKTGGTHFTQWNNAATSSPIDDVEAGKETVLQNTGIMPNTLVMGYQVFRKLKQHPEIQDRIKYTIPVLGSTVAEALLADMFGLDRVLVAKAVKNAAVENATDSYSFFLGKNALLVYVPPKPGHMVPAAGYKFMWKGISDGLGETVGITKFYLPQLRAWRVEAQMAWDDKKVAAALGYYYSGAVA